MVQKLRNFGAYPVVVRLVDSSGVEDSIQLLPRSHATLGANLCVVGQLPASVVVTDDSPAAPVVVAEPEVVPVVEKVAAAHSTSNETTGKEGKERKQQNG
jgi:hypothetical protein